MTREVDGHFDQTFPSASISVHVVSSCAALMLCVHALAGRLLPMGGAGWNKLVLRRGDRPC